MGIRPQAILRSLSLTAWRQAGCLSDGSIRKTRRLSRKRSLHRSPQFLGREWFRQKSIRLHRKAPRPVIPKARHHQDAQLGVRLDALLQKRLDAHRGIMEIRNQQNRFGLRRAQARESSPSVKKTLHEIPRRVQHERVQLRQARRVVHCVNNRRRSNTRAGAGIGVAGFGRPERHRTIRRGERTMPIRKWRKQFAVRIRAVHTNRRAIRKRGVIHFTSHNRIAVG